MESTGGSKKKKGNKKVKGQKNAKPSVNEGPSAHQQLARELAPKDERFSSAFSNPIFRSVPKNEKKIDIDQRFKSMFHDEKFKLQYKVDKRGRPTNTSTDDNLAKYYNLIEDDDKAEVKSGSESESSSEEADSDVDADEQESGENEPKIKSHLPDAVKQKLHNVKIDYARGEGALISEESSDEDTSESENEEEDVEHEWGELDKNAPRTEEETRRLALCNMDWDRLKAVDLMVLFNSFLPPGGILVSVSMYISEFGKGRMAEEDLRGPLELTEFKKEAVSDEEEKPDDEEEEEGSSYHREKLRTYQLNRLKYFYAVLEFDSKATAEKVYAECDGLEYESSSAKIDLRFIPDDMTFDDDPKDTCNSVPDGAKYRPKFFTTTALQQIKVDCTWDETDPNRKEIIEKVLDRKANIDDDDIKAYLGSSSSDSEDETVDEQSQDLKPSTSAVDPIAKYRMLLESIEKSEQDKKKDVELEITWGVGLKQKTEELVKKKAQEEEVSKMTPWEAQMVKQKEKRHLKKVQKRKSGKSPSDSDNSSASESSDEEDEGIQESQPFSDDDVDVDMNDPFFKQSVDTDSQKTKNKNKPEQVGKRKHENTEEKNEELGLLMDDDDGKKHFNFKKIVDDENVSKSKRKRKIKRDKISKSSTVEGSEDFEVNVDDDRFAALYTSHHFNIDPSKANFKKTKGMEAIIQTKQTRRAKASGIEDIPKPDKLNPVPEKRKQQVELSYLVNSIKKNAKINKASKRRMK